MTGHTLDVHVTEMRTLAKQLMKYSFPQGTLVDEEIISILKQREITIDGYELVVYFNRCSHLGNEMETIQIFGKHFTFIPFWLICKVAILFLGDKELSFTEITRHNREGVFDEYTRKIYIWTVCFNAAYNKPITNPYIPKTQLRSYEGLNFYHVDIKQIKFI